MKPEDFKPDASALAGGLRKIAALADYSESDREKMLDLINDISDVIEAARAEYRKAVTAAQEAELEYLWSL